jgi:hypothetical protein
MDRFFGDREHGPRPRVEEVISGAAWRAIWALIESRIEDGSFGRAFPVTCDESHAVVATDRAKMLNLAVGLVPGIAAAFENAHLGVNALPPTVAILELIEFCYDRVAAVTARRSHHFWKHDHLTFSQSDGRRMFSDEVNQLLARQGLVYELGLDGKIVRPAPVVLREQLGTELFSTGDDVLDALLEKARRKFLSPREAERRESREHLWDAFERVKTVEHKDKAKGAEMILDRSAAPAVSPVLRASMRSEAKALTELGNNLTIRHHEVGREAIQTSEQVDYLFGRMFSFILLQLKASGRGG